jgi:hypothetical protein
MIDVDGQADAILKDLPAPSSLAGYRMTIVEFEKVRGERVNTQRFDADCVWLIVLLCV